jgi:hypothetical protein
LSRDNVAVWMIAILPCCPRGEGVPQTRRFRRGCIKDVLTDRGLTLALIVGIVAGYVACKLI